LGAILGATGRKSEAVDANQTAVALSPQDADAHSNLGVTLQEIGKLDEALASYTQAIALNPDFADAHSNLGSTLKELGRLEKAEASYIQAIALKPDLAEAHSNLGSTLKELGRLDEAEASLRQAIALKPDFAEGHSNLGVTLHELGKLDEALASYTQALALKPDYALAHSNLGNTLHELGRFDEAQASFTQAIALKPDFVEAHYNLSNNLSYMNDLEKEICAWKKLLNLDADDFGLRASTNLAICNFLEGDFEESRKQVSAAEKIQEKTHSKFKNEKAYQRYLLKILKWHEDKHLDVDKGKSDKTLYVLGESHCLTSHHLRVQHSGFDFSCQANLIKGCKQWHLATASRNHYKNKFESIFCALPKHSYVLLAIGEIDCRLDEGIIKHMKKFPDKNIKDIIVTTVESYIAYIVKNNSSSQHNITVQGVPCPNIDIENNAEKDVMHLVEVIKTFNFELKIKAEEKRLGFLDVHSLTDRGDGFSNNLWHNDSHHISPEGMIEAWRRYTSAQSYE
jgi:tetratricopeptide (TPR) repeat protein